MKLVKAQGMDCKFYLKVCDDRGWLSTTGNTSNQTKTKHVRLASQRHGDRQFHDELTLLQKGSYGEEMFGICDRGHSLTQIKIWSIHHPPEVKVMMNRKSINHLWVYSPFDGLVFVAAILGYIHARSSGSSKSSSLSCDSRRIRLWSLGLCRSHG